MDILTIRQCIDTIDTKILESLGRRMQVVKGIALLKEKIRDPKRERDLHRKWKQKAKEEGISARCAEEILRAILKESRKIQRTQQ